MSRGWEWMASASCAGVDPADADKMFNLDRAHGDRPDTVRGRGVCEGCPVAAECLAQAIALHETSGLWAGLNVRVRRLVARRAAAAGVLPARGRGACDPGALAEWIRANPGEIDAARRDDLDAHRRCKAARRSRADTA